MSRLPIAKYDYSELGTDLAPKFELSFYSLSDRAYHDEIVPLIAGVTFEEDETLASEMTLKIANQGRTAPGEPVDWGYVIDHKAFAEGNTVDLFMGYGSTLGYMGRCDVLKWLPRFTGDPSFEIKARDGRHKMMLGNEFRIASKNTSRKRRTAYRNTPDHEIVKRIAAKYGYRADVDPSVVGKRSRIIDGKSVSYIPTRVQTSDMADWDLLLRLAEINGFDLWVDSEAMGRPEYTVHFKQKRDAGAAGYVFTWNGTDGSLLEAEPDFSIQDQPTDVEILHFDRKRREIQRTIISDVNDAERLKLGATGVGNMQAQQEVGKGARVRFSAFGQVIEAFSDKPMRSTKEAELFVQRWLKERERDFLILRGKVVGVEDVHPRQIHFLNGMSTRLNGFYRFVQTKHSMMGGDPYTVDFVAHKVLSEDLEARPASSTVKGPGRKQAAG